MWSAIVDKLNAHMECSAQSESDVVYALVQIRKLLELTGQKEQYDKLVFMCDWAVHAKMSGKTAKNIVQTLDERMVGIPLQNLDALDPDGKASEVLSLRMSHSELLQFCKGNELRTEWFDTTERWGHFLWLYARIIQDCPLEIGTTQGTSPKKLPSTPLKKLQKVVLIASDPTEQAIEEPHPGKVLLRLTWQLTLIDGSPFQCRSNLVLSD
jgi:hypothetical protein